MLSALPFKDAPGTVKRRVMAAQFGCVKWTWDSGALAIGGWRRRVSILLCSGWREGDGDPPLPLTLTQQALCLLLARDPSAQNLAEKMGLSASTIIHPPTQHR